MVLYVRAQYDVLNDCMVTYNEILHGAASGAHLPELVKIRKNDVGFHLMLLKANFPLHRLKLVAMC